MFGLTLALLEGPDPMARFMAWGALLTVVVGIVAALCTVMVVFMFWNAFAVRGEAKEAVQSFEKKLKDLDDNYNLSKMKLPDDILKEAFGQARSEYDPRLSGVLLTIERISEEVKQLRGLLAKNESKDVALRELSERPEQVTRPSGLSGDVHNEPANNRPPKAVPTGGLPGSLEPTNAQVQEENRSPNPQILATRSPKQ